MLLICGSLDLAAEHPASAEKLNANEIAKAAILFISILLNLRHPRKHLPQTPSREARTRLGICCDSFCFLLLRRDPTKFCFNQVTKKSI
jgi:hypothetical protein